MYQRRKFRIGVLAKLIDRLRFTFMDEEQQR